jgi:rhodanese-related sulfurtransferase
MDKEVYMICRSGRRSENAIHFLETQGYMNLINVEGGTLGFIEQKENNV